MYNFDTQQHKLLFSPHVTSKLQTAGYNLFERNNQFFNTFTYYILSNIYVQMSQVYIVCIAIA